MKSSTTVFSVGCGVMATHSTSFTPAETQVTDYILWQGARHPIRFSLNSGPAFTCILPSDFILMICNLYTRGTNTGEDKALVQINLRFRVQTTSLKSQFPVVQHPTNPPKTAQVFACYLNAHSTSRYPWLTTQSSMAHWNN